MRWLLCLAVVACAAKHPTAPRPEDRLAQAFASLPAVPGAAALSAFAGTILADDLPALWSAAQRWERGEVESEVVNDLTVALDAKLRDAKLGYFVMIKLDDAHRVSLLTYAVRDVTIATVGPDRFPIYVLEPIGTTVTPESAGQTFRGMPLVHMRAATSDAVNLLSALSTKRVFELGIPKLDQPLTQHVLDETRAMVGNVDHAVAIGDLLVQWAQRRGAGYLDVENEPTGPLSPELSDLERELTARDARSLIAALERRVLRRVKLHEVQHAIDYKVKRFDTLFAPLTSLITQESLPVQLLATMELSAWTATFARDFSWFDFALGLGYAHLDGVPTAYAFAFIADGLARKFDPSAQPCLHDGAIDRDRLHVNATLLVQHDARELAAAARELWETWFVARLDPIDL